MSDLFSDDGVDRWPATEKWDYKDVFYFSGGEIDASPRYDFFATAKASVERLATGVTLAEVEGMAALYLFRHYLELALKDIVFSCRSLQFEGNSALANAPIWPTGHDLQKLWAEAEEQVPATLGKEAWMQWDHSFVDKCIVEFDKVDPTSERLRYLKTRKPATYDQLQPLRVSWDVLRTVMQHVHDVLEAIDSDLLETSS